MKPGDLVRRKVNVGCWKSAREERARNGIGIILSKYMGGRNPVHPCIKVLYPKTGEAWDIAEVRMEVVSEI